MNNPIYLIREYFTYYKDHDKYPREDIVKNKEDALLLPWLVGREDLSLDGNLIKSGNQVIAICLTIPLAGKKLVL